MAKDFNRDDANAIVRKIMSDPVLSERYWHNLKEEAARNRSMEDWANDGFVSNGARNHDLREEELL